MQVNLSAAEIARPLLVEEVAAIIRDANLPHGVLRVELTEQAALRDFEGALGALAAFRAAGAGIVLDDFGAGHSSFAWLAEIPADGVKLDPKLSRMVRQPARLPHHHRAHRPHPRPRHDRHRRRHRGHGRSPANFMPSAATSCRAIAYDMPLRLPDIAVAFDPLPARA